MILPYLAIALLLLATVYSAIVSFRPKREGERSSWIFPGPAKRWARNSVIVGTLVIVVGAAAWVSLGGRSSTSQPLRILIPENYSGWVRVEFGIKSAPGLPVESGYTVARIPASGRLQTSSAEQYGLTKDSFFFDSVSGLRPIPYSGPGRLIWGRISGEAMGAAGKKTYEEFFVGSEQQYREQISGLKDSKAP